MGDISKLGMEFGQHVQKVTQELLLAGTPGSLSEMERKIRQALLQIGQFLLGAWIMLQEGPYPPTEIACRCGQQAHYQRKRAGGAVHGIGDGALHPRLLPLFPLSPGDLSVG